MFLLSLMSFQETKDRPFRNGGGKRKVYSVAEFRLAHRHCLQPPGPHGGSGFKSMVSSNNSILHPN